MRTVNQIKSELFNLDPMTEPTHKFVTLSEELDAAYINERTQVSSLWVYEWDGVDCESAEDDDYAYAECIERARKLNIGVVYTDYETALFIGFKDDLEKFLADEKVYDADNIAQFHYINTPEIVE